jgi:cysteinyl-tRNA synthetase
MVLKLYNTLTRKKEVFKPIKKGEVGMYGCGPTVYWYPHIGNARRMVFEDLLYRTLVYNKFKVKHIMNITDVGHLVADSDDGEDKVEKAAKKEGKTAKEITRHYYDAFIADLEKLNIIKPDKWTWASEHVKEQIEIVKTLEEKGFTYKTSDGIYFDTSKLKDYGKLALLNVDGLKAGKRIAVGEKKNKTDFALWKFSIPGEKRQQEWDSPWGVGFPGWHIECSAMSSKYLGKQFDIHTGGIDNMNPHHINEIAQSETAFGVRPWVKYWLHNNHLNLKEGKMSKSSGDITRIIDLEEKGYSGLGFRYFLLTAHYRKRTAFDFKLMGAAQTAYERLKKIVAEIKDDGKVNEKAVKDFEKAMNDDLNSSRALQILWGLVRDEKAVGKIGAIKKIDEILGLELLKKDKKEKVSSEVMELVKDRETARKDKDWKLADELRDKIKEKGYVVEDKEGKSVVEKI